MEITHNPEDLVERCRAAGLKATPQRLAVYAAVVESTSHPAPEALLHAVRGAMPTVSLATIYKSLDALEGAGLIKQVSLHQTKRYDGNLTPHHHLICEGCGCVRDLEMPELTPTVPNDILGFAPREVRLQIVGLCTTCRAGSTSTDD